MPIILWEDLDVSNVNYTVRKFRSKKCPFYSEEILKYEMHIILWEDLLVKCLFFRVKIYKLERPILQWKV